MGQDYAFEDKAALALRPEHTAAIRGCKALMAIAGQLPNMVWHPRWLRWHEAHALSEANSSWQARVRALLSVLGRCLCHRRWWSSLPAQLAKQQPDAKGGCPLRVRTDVAGSRATS